jgi:hypothetical protein
VFENRVLRRIFEPKRKVVTGVWRKLQDKKLHSFYFLLNIRVNKSRRMRYTGHIAHVGEMRN